MKLLSCYVENFGSYKSLNIDFQDKGLSLIYGKTGSGKSTIPDIACWALFGATARGGAVDDIKSWTSNGEVTAVSLKVETQNVTITVVRTRGSAKQNDLCWYESGNGDPIRGKDLQDTQKKLVARLGVDLDTFVASAYFHEFSESGNFFVLRAKERRAIFERLANLDLPARLAEAASTRRKSAKIELADKQRELDKLEGKIEQLDQVYQKHSKLYEEWVDKQEQGELVLFNRLTNLKFSLDLKISETPDLSHLLFIKEELSKEIQKQAKVRCLECGGPKKSSTHSDLQARLSLIMEDICQAKIDQAEHRRITADIDRLNAEIDKIRDQTENPWIKTLSEDDEAMYQAQRDYDLLRQSFNETSSLVNSLDQLYDLSSTLRGELLRRTIKQIQEETNRYLETYFDGEIKVEFSIDAQKDDLGVVIRKSGYEANYTQLSKGQRSLLRLCFSVAVMQQASNKSGVHQDCLFFDEFTDGLSEDLKEKVFGLLSELETRHSSVFVIDHSQSFQNMFSNRYHVTLEGDESSVQLEANS